MTLDAPRVAHVKAERVRWLWRGWLPRGKLIVIDGDPGLGKSTATLDLAARFSTASPLPDGTQLDGPVNTILMSAEDSIADTIRPRLEAAGADLDRITVFRGINEIDGPRPPDLPADLDKLESLIVEENASLVVVDPLMAFLGGRIDAHVDQDVRRALHALSAVAERTDVGIILVRHLNKAPGGNALYRGGGSIGIIGAARAGMLVAPDPSDEHRRILACTKSNLAEKPKSLAYRLLSDEEHDCARIQWDGESNLTADALLSPPRESKRDDAAEFLEGVLADGPVPQSEIRFTAKRDDISWASVRRAKDDLAIDAFRKGDPGKRGGGSWFWKLPGLGAQDLDAQPLPTQLSTLIPDPVSAGQSPSSNGQKVKVLMSDVGSERGERSERSTAKVAPMHSDLISAGWTWVEDAAPCIVCEGDCPARDPLGRVRHPVCEAPA